MAARHPAATAGPTHGRRPAALSGGAALHWFTSDLRLDDHPALAAAGRDAAVAGVFVLQPALLRRHAAAERRVAYMLATLHALDARLRALGSRLVVLEGDPAEELPRLAARLRAVRVTVTPHREPAAIAREVRVRRALAEAGTGLEAVESTLVHAAGSIRTGGGEIYRVFTPFWRAWRDVAMPPVAATPERWVPASALDGLGRALPPVPPAGLPPVGEEAARTRLADFLAGVAGYPDLHDVPSADATSRLSPHLRWGTLSAVAAVRAARAAAGRDAKSAAGAEAWVRQLAWRDFFAHLLAAHPRLAREPMRGLGIACRTDDHAFRRWQEGRTGVPLVDAGMRELAATGWMHNRVRLVVGSFLSRHLLLDWRLGERHFMEQLLDGELSQNDGNWQWVAGTGADAQPFHRIFSPVRQGERFDPDGAYVKRWVPELQRVPASCVHQPWTLGPLERRGLCLDYPEPVVDLDEGRARALAAFSAARAAR